MPAGGFHHHQVSGLDALARSVYVDAFAGVLEADLVVVTELLLRDALEHVVYLQFATALAVADIFFTRLFVRYHGTSAETVKLDGFI